MKTTSLKAVHPKEADHLTKEEEEETSQDSDDDVWGQWGGKDLTNQLRALRSHTEKKKDVLIPQPPGVPPMCDDPSHQQCGFKATPKKKEGIDI